MSAPRLIGLSLALYAVFLPAMWFVGRDYVPAQRPKGSVVEKIAGFHFDDPDHYFVRSHIFTPQRFPDTSRLAVFEETVPLRDFSFTADHGEYVARFKTSDGSDPRTNRRNYWIVCD